MRIIQVTQVVKTKLLRDLFFERMRCFFSPMKKERYIQRISAKKTWVFITGKGKIIYLQTLETLV